MPIYDYVCSTCGHKIEVMHGVHAHGPAACPNCGGPMKKSYAPPAVHFRGTGWARKERSGSSRPKKSESPAPETKEAPKTESPKEAD